MRRMCCFYEVVQEITEMPAFTTSAAVIVAESLSVVPTSSPVLAHSAKSKVLPQIVRLVLACGAHRWFLPRIKENCDLFAVGLALGGQVALVAGVRLVPVVVRPDLRQRLHVRSTIYARMNSKDYVSGVHSRDPYVFFTCSITQRGP